MSPKKADRPHHTKILVVLLVAQLVFSIAFADKFRYDSHGKRDPFVVPGDSSQPIAVMKVESPTNIKLEGVMVEVNGKSMALIGGEVYQIGDRVGTYQIKRISNDGVAFEGAGREFVIPIQIEDGQVNKKKRGPV